MRYRILVLAVAGCMLALGCGPTPVVDASKQDSQFNPQMSAHQKAARLAHSQQ